jgi:hypothetical protein
MKKFSSIFFSVVAACGVSPVVFSASASEQDIQALTRRAATLEQESRTLNAEINRLRAKRAPKHASKHAPKRKPVVKKSVDAAALATNNPEIDLAYISPQVEQRIHQTALNYIRGVTVTTSPILGLKSAWNPSDLLYTIPSMNQDLMLLMDRQRFQKILEKMGSSLDTRPLLVFSGGLEGGVNYIKDFSNTSTTDVNLATAELDAWAIISSWASAWISIEYDDSPPQTGMRVTNSRLFLQRGFLTIGNLDKSPWYFTAGQMFLPFGRYPSAMITSALTKTIGRIEQRALLLGFYKRGFYAEGYGFKGEEYTANNSAIFQGGVNSGYQNQKLSIGSLDIGAGWVSNMADSLGMQFNRLSPGGSPSSQFAGFSYTTIGNNPTVSSEHLKHSVPGGNLHLEYGRGIFAFMAEYVGGLQSFNAGDLMYQSKGANPKAIHLESDLNFQFGQKPLTIGAAYDESWQALPLNVPKQSYFAVISTSWWKDTQQSLEYRHDVNYARMPNNTVGGGGNGNINNILPVPDANVGGSQDMISFSFGVYF